MTRIWFRHPDTDRIHEIGWRGRHLIDAPLVDVLVDRVNDRIRERGGNRVLKKRTIMLQIVDEIGDLATPKGRTSHERSCLRRTSAGDKRNATTPRSKRRTGPLSLLNKATSYGSPPRRVQQQLRADGLRSCRGGRRRALAGLPRDGLTWMLMTGTGKRRHRPRVA